MSANQPPAACAALALSLLLAAAAGAQDDYAPRPAATPSPAKAEADARPADAATAAARPADARRVRPLEAPPLDRPLAPAPGGVSANGPVPAPPQDHPYALVGATVHTVSGVTLEGAALLLQDGLIAYIGPRREWPPGTETIDVSGRHVYPSLISAATILGLVEIGAVRATRDHREVGDLNPNVRAEVSVNPSSDLIPVTRSNGILVAMTAPSGGLVAGLGAVIELDGWTYEEMTARAPAALLVDWPAMALDRRPGAKVPLEKQERERDQRIEQLREAFATARAYARGIAAPGTPAKDRDVKWEALAQAASAAIPVVVRANSALEIAAALRFAEQERLRLVLLGGQDAWRFAPTLRQRRVPVLVGNVFDLPRPWEPYDEGFTAPLRLFEAGVEYAIVSSSSGGEAAHERNLPYLAARAASYGLPPDEALRAVTLYPARILGLGDRLGSLEPGKDATLIVTDGDPLDARSNVHHAFVRGKRLDLTDRHKRLYERQRERPRAAGAGAGAGAPRR